METGANEPMLRIDKDFISTLPLMQYTGKIVLVESEKDARKAVSELSRERVLGFDTETRPCFHKGAGYLVSLVQLCGKKCAYLFRLDYCGGVPVLFPLFENPRILKVGVAVRDDVHHLKMRAPFDDAGFVDASKYTRAARIENTGLRALTAHFLGGRISKAAQVSNWAARQLSPQQIVYAATDAWTSRELFLKLQKLGIAPQMDSAGAICDPEIPAEFDPASAVPADAFAGASPSVPAEKSAKNSGNAKNPKNAKGRGNGKNSGKRGAGKNFGGKNSEKSGGNGNAKKPKSGRGNENRGNENRGGNGKNSGDSDGVPA